MDENELLIERSKPKERKKINLVFVTIDDWNRPIFQRLENGDRVSHYYCCLNKLFSEYDTIEKLKREITVKDLTYFGRDYDCDPLGLNLNHKDYKFVINWEE